MVEGELVTINLYKKQNNMLKFLVYSTNILKQLCKSNRYKNVIREWIFISIDRGELARLVTILGNPPAIFYLKQPTKSIGLLRILRVPERTSKSKGYDSFKIVNLSLTLYL